MFNIPLSLIVSKVLFFLLFFFIRVKFCRKCFLTDTTRKFQIYKDIYHKKSRFFQSKITSQYIVANAEFVLIFTTISHFYTNNNYPKIIFVFQEKTCQNSLLFCKITLFFFKIRIFDKYKIPNS